MKKIFTWAARGGITAALILLVISVWPSRVVETSQEFELALAETVPAEIHFSVPEVVHRGERVEFGISVDLASMPELLTDVNPVMVYRLELNGAEIIPDAFYQIPLRGVQHQETGWMVRLPQAGQYDGTWWVYLENVPSDGTEVEREALFAKRFQVKSREILGMSVTGARWVSMILILIGLGYEVWGSIKKEKRAKG